MGIYQIALSVFAVFVTVASSGVPITVSRLMSKYRAKGELAREKSVITAGICVSLVFSIPVVAIFYLLGSNAGFLFSDGRCLKLFFIMLPGLIFTSVYAVFRGAFWGKKDFLPYSITELLEEVCMVIAGTVAVLAAQTLMQGAVGAAFAVLISYIFSFALSMALFFPRHGKLKFSKKEFSPLMKSALPITGMRTISSALNSLIAIVLPLMLIKNGLSNSQAMVEFGNAYGMAIPILFMPSTIIGSLALVLVPELSETYYKGEAKTLKMTIEKALKFSVLVSSLIVPVFLALGEEIGVIIYGSKEAGVYISRAAIMTLPMSISMISTSMLNSMGKEKSTLVTYLTGTALMILSILILTPFIGINSLIVGYILSFTCSAAGNMFLISKTSEHKLQYKKFVTLAAIFIIPSALAARFFYNITMTVMPSVVAFILASVVSLIFNTFLYFIFDLISLDLIGGKLRKSGIFPFGRKRNRSCDN